MEPTNYKEQALVEFRKQTALLERLVENTSKGTRKAKKAERIYTNDFEMFWAAYPRKVGKGDACDSWNKLKPPLDLCLSGIDACKKTSQWQSGPIPHPATWLNQERWKDEPTNKKPTKEPDKCCVCGGPPTLYKDNKWWCAKPECRAIMYGI